MSAAVVDFLDGVASADLEIDLTRPIFDRDQQVALWLTNHVRTNLTGCVDPEKLSARWFARVCWILENWFETALVQQCPPPPAPRAPRDIALVLQDSIARPTPDALGHAVGNGPDCVSRLFAAKAPYLLSEADPHTLAIARLPEAIQQIVIAIQAGEYGVGHATTHARIFRECLGRLGWNPAAAVSAAPTAAIAFANAAWLFGNRPHLAPAAVGQLAFIELDSVDPCRAMSEAFQRVGLPKEAARWLDIHVLADAEHGEIVTRKLLPAVSNESDRFRMAFVHGVEITSWLQIETAREFVRSGTASSGLFEEDA